MRLKIRETKIYCEQKCMGQYIFAVEINKMHYYLCKCEVSVSCSFCASSYFQCDFIIVFTTVKTASSRSAFVTASFKRAFKASFSLLTKMFG